MSNTNNVPNWHSSPSERTLYLANRQFPVASQPIAHNEFYGGGGHRSGIHSSELPTDEEGNLSPASSEGSSYYKVDFSDLADKTRTTTTTQARTTRARQEAPNPIKRPNPTRLKETIVIDSDSEGEIFVSDAPLEAPPPNFIPAANIDQAQLQSRRAEVISLGSESDFEANPPLPSNPQASVFKMSALDIVQDAQLRSVLQAADRACEQCIAILDLIQANRNPKASSTYEQDLSNQQKVLYSHLAVVRGLNRKALLNARKTKQETTDARQEVDKLHLQLQNLYYEQRHFRGEITVCKNYDHSYERLPMIDLDEFLKIHPQYAGASEHDQMLARIEHEHSVRVALEETRQGLLKKKQTFIAENNKRKEILAGLDKSVEKWMEGAKVVEQEFVKAEQEMKNREETWNGNSN
ncbi:DNA replication licensing factor [Venturia inaequalis]|uniref:Uncharacterized protein n=1 Tax=Venturia inaequalis TaxID=5025 RepID=A0A8H3VLK5_VENIN|nr:hypothetical protein EG327_008767 [Venturia inaequalis]RDI79563.1 DNA replication licensing factor [Venturia inaequalis]